MVTMKFALVSLTLIVLLDAYNARHLHDASIKRSFDGRSLFYGVVIQMVTGEKLRLPQSSRLSSLVHDHQTAYGRVNKPPPPPIVAPSKGQATYTRVNSSPPPPNVAPSKGQSTYTRVNSSPPPPNVAPSKGQSTYTRVNSSPPPPIVAPSKGQETYTRVNLLPYVAPSEGQETYGQLAHHHRHQ
ncbi:uncharacterized protein LOC143582132 [Bidens hawaiensis]|uniref:uncharacterized protein LOC143582132 n=1 Tax=Bidens hawaiensis TaxID=980011 RepID=UPI00404924EB